MTPEFGYYTALICVSTGMMVLCALLSAGSRALPTPQRKMMFVPFCIVMVTAFLEWGGEAIEELPMALAMFDAAVENERKTDPMMPTISYGYATCKPGEKNGLGNDRRGGLEHVPYEAPLLFRSQYSGKSLK